MPFSISSLTHSLLNSFSSTAYITRSNRQTKEHHNTHTQTHTLAALCIPNIVRHSAWHLAVRRRVLCQDAPHGDTVAAVSLTMAQCVWQRGVCICILSTCVCIHVSGTNPSMSWERVCVHCVCMLVCVRNCPQQRDTKLCASHSAPPSNHKRPSDSNLPSCVYVSRSR